jgi:hypothetical protein
MGLNIKGFFLKNVQKEHAQEFGGYPIGGQPF